MPKRIRNTRGVVPYRFKGEWHAFFHEGAWRLWFGFLILGLWIGIPACHEYKAKAKPTRYNHMSSQDGSFRPDEQYFEDQIKLLEEIRDELKKLNKEK